MLRTELRSLGPCMGVTDPGGGEYRRPWALLRRSCGRRRLARDIGHPSAHRIQWGVHRPAYSSRS